MMTLITTAEYPPVAPVVVKVGKSWCVMIDGIDPPAGCARIPITVFRDFAWRDSAQWHTPDTAARGRALVNEMTESWISSLIDVPDNILSASGSIEPLRTGKSMIDIQRERERKMRR